MGAIQNSVNQILGTTAAAVGVGKKAMKEKKLEHEQGLLAKEQFHEAEADKRELEAQADEQKNVWGEAEGDLAILQAKRPGGKGNTKAALEEKRMQKMNEIEAAQRAFQNLQDKIEAKKAMMERAQSIMKRTKVGGIN